MNKSKMLINEVHSISEIFRTCSKCKNLNYSYLCIVGCKAEKVSTMQTCPFDFAVQNTYDRLQDTCPCYKK